MRSLIWLHVAGGAISLAAGYAALFSAKGAALHRHSGRAFVYAMLTMGLTGAVIAAMTAVETSVVMGVFAAYLVYTGFAAVRPQRSWLNAAAGVAAWMLSIALADLGVRALNTPSGAIEGLPAPMAFGFALIAVLSGISDMRRVAGVPLDSRARLVRHLWRMCFALFVAAASFFFGQADEIPAALQLPALLAVPVIMPLIAIGFWWPRMRRGSRARAAIINAGPVAS